MNKPPTYALDVGRFTDQGTSYLPSGVPHHASWNFGGESNSRAGSSYRLTQPLADSAFVFALRSCSKHCETTLQSAGPKTQRWHESQQASQRPQQRSAPLVPSPCTKRLVFSQEGPLGVMRTCDMSDLGWPLGRVDTVAVTAVVLAVVGTLAVVARILESSPRTRTWTAGPRPASNALMQ